MTHYISSYSLEFLVGWFDPFSGNTFAPKAPMAACLEAETMNTRCEPWVLEVSHDNAAQLMWVES